VGLHRVARLAVAGSGDLHTGNSDTAVAVDADNSDTSVDLRSDDSAPVAGLQKAVARHWDNAAKAEDLQAVHHSQAQ